MNILAARAAVGVLKTGRPVKIRYRREESIKESYKRHPYRMHYKVGCTSDGKIRAMKIDILADGGAYASMSPFVTWRTVVQATGPYEIKNVWTDVRAVYTNNPYTGAMRGFGSPQPIFAQESIMDEIAIKLGKSPLEIRRINVLKKGSLTATGHKLAGHDVNLTKVLNVAVRKTNFTRHWKKNRNINIQKAPLGENFLIKEDQFSGNNQRIQKGIGLAVSFRGCSLGAEGIDATAAYLVLQNDGTAYLLSGLAENGQGMRTTYAIIAAEVLGIRVDDIHYLDMDTGYIADSGPTVASRATLMGGGAVKNAAEILRKRLEAVLREEWHLSKNQRIKFKASKVTTKGSGKRLSFPDLCRLAYQKGVNLSAIGWYNGPTVHWDEKKGQGPAYFTYVYGCQVAEVSVNPITGEVLVDRITAVHDPGKVINLLGARGQVYGGVTQGTGYGLWEQISAHDGFIRELNFDQFLIPTSKDIGEINPIFVEGRDRYGPWGAKSLGEPTLELTAAAIANAIRNATGKRFFNLPLNLEEIILGKKLFPEDTIRGSAK
jgi:CO/xanthine dehydrogenase Mo-binding subunit